jgi:glutamate carboxypeptidase
MMTDELLRYLPTRLDETLRWLERMVGINSFTTNIDGVNSLGQLTAECFASLGFEARQVPSREAEHGSHLYLGRGPRSQRPVLLVTHLDTVFPPEEEQRENFRWQPEPSAGRIYGPGTVDIKGGTMLLWLMLHGLRQVAPEVFEQTHWLIAANSAEEVMSRDFAARTAEHCPQGAQAVLVFEGGPIAKGQYHLVTARKGRALYRLEAHGKAAHAGSAHHEGLNAIVALTPAIQAAAALTDYAADLTVNVGTVSGGTVLNRVPHQAHAELEMRAYDPALLEQAGARLLALQDEVLRVSCLGLSPAWPGKDAASGLLAEHWTRAAGQLGLAPLLVSRGGLSDANYLCQLGPTLDGLGPSGGNAHCSERSADGSKLPEYVEPASFVPKAAMNILALLDMLGRAPCPN